MKMSYIFCLIKNTILTLMLTSMVFGSVAFAQETASVSDSAQKKELGFKLGKLRLHPAFSLQNLWDSNVSNTSDRYEDDPNSGVTVDQDWVLHILGGLRLDYPDDIITFSLEGSIGYKRYFGMDNSDTTDLSALTGKVRAGIHLLKNYIFDIKAEDAFTRSSQPQQVGIATTNDRIYNEAKLTLGLKPGGGQLRFYLGYAHELERYDGASRANLNWMQHNVFLKWELEFLPKTAIFMDSSIGFRDYYDFDPARDDFSTNSASPNSMPFRVALGIMGRVTSKLLLNISAGYGNSFSENFEDYSNVVAKAELTAQFTRRTTLKLGFERDYSVIPTFSYIADNKVYLEFRQWLVSDNLRLSLYGSFSYIQYGPYDEGVDVDARPGTTANITDRSDMLWTVTPNIQYYFLAWLSADLGYKFSYRDTDYLIRRINLDGDDILSYYDYMKHEVFLKINLSY